MIVDLVFVKLLTSVFLLSPFFTLPLLDDSIPPAFYYNINLPFLPSLSYFLLFTTPPFLVDSTGFLPSLSHFLSETYVAYPSSFHPLLVTITVITFYWSWLHFILHSPVSRPLRQTLHFFTSVSLVYSVIQRQFTKAALLFCATPVFFLFFCFLCRVVWLLTGSHKRIIIIQ